jgi:hypothetical protein
VAGRPRADKGVGEERHEGTEVAGEVGAGVAKKLFDMPPK